MVLDARYGTPMENFSNILWKSPNELEEGFFSDIFEYHKYTTKIFLNRHSLDFIMIK